MNSAFIDKFSDHAELYRRARPAYPEHLFDVLASLAPARELAWDCGAGNGQAAVALARHFAAVHASEPSAQQLAEAIADIRVGYHCERAEEAALPDCSVDLILAAQALHWFDLERFFGQVRRVLKPGGIFAAIGYDWMYVDPAIDAAIGDKLMPLLEQHWDTRNALLWAGYREIPFPGDEVRIGPFAIHLDWNFEEARAYLLSWSAVRNSLAAGGIGSVVDAIGHIGELWGSQCRRVVMPLFVRVAILP